MQKRICAMKKVKILLITFGLLISSVMFGQRVRVFETHKDSIPYRIPALAVCRDGSLIAVSDYRFCGRDIGYGAVDLHWRMSRDNGRTWGEEKILAHGTAEGKENTFGFAYGDAAIVADRQSDEVLLLCVSGQVVYFDSKRDNPNRVARFRSHDGGRTWSAAEEITEHIYGLLDVRTAGGVQGLFFGSGKIAQSRKVRVGKYYRLYAAVVTHSGVFALYSDDFGETWKVLGDVETSPCPKGDEPKCEELPDGSVVLSVRTEGRFFNVFTFSNKKKARGTWGEPVLAPAFAGIKNACNGEVLLVKARRKSDGKRTNLLLQTVPFGPQRRHVGFFYKELKGKNDWKEIGEGWQRGLQVSNGLSAYSTMVQLHDGRIGFLWEEGPTNYNIDFQPLTISEITSGEYR